MRLPGLHCYGTLSLYLGCSGSVPARPACYWPGGASYGPGQAGQARALLAMNDFIFMNGLGCCELH